MIKTYNDVIRYRIFNSSLLDTHSYISKLDKKSYTNLVRLFLSDYYKLDLFYAIVKKDFSRLQEFEDNSVEELINRFNEDVSFKQKVLLFSKEFNSLNFLSKVYLMDTISMSANDKTLFNISKSYILDLMYDISYNLCDLKKDYNEYKESKYSLYGEDMPLFIAHKLINYSTKNSIQYKKIVLELLRKYYMRNIFIKDNLDDEIEEDDMATITLYLSIIELEPLDRIINLSLNDSEFLADILFDYFEYNEDELGISDDDIEEYFDVNADEEVKQKLKRTN